MDVFESRFTHSFISFSQLLSSLFSPRWMRCAYAMLALALLQPTPAQTAAHFSGSAGKTATSTTLTVTSGDATVTDVPATTVMTLTATVQAGSTAAQLGTVNFCDASAKSCTDIHLIGTAQLTKDGTATTRLRPGIGTHSYKAVFLGTKSNSASASSPSALTVTEQNGEYPTTTAIAQSGNPGDYTLTATVSGPGIASPSGSVSFVDKTDGQSVLDTATLGAGTPTFSLLNSWHLFTYIAPQAPQVGDFNGDGILDIASAGNSGVTFLLGKGDGTFTTRSSVGNCDVADAMAVADFNGDGIPDVAVTCPADSTVNVYLGNGDGTFTAKSSPPTGNWPNGLAVADFNGDGILDLAVANAPCCGTTTPYLTILLGNGDGTFTAAPNAPAPTETWDVKVGDVNGDGIPDLVFSNQYTSNNTIAILLGNGDGTFTAAPSVAAGIGNNDVHLGDFNGDGKEDMVLSYSKGGGITILQMMLGNGDGTFTATAEGPITLPYSASINVGDFNGDGVLDLYVMDGSDNTVRLMLGNGDGTFTTTAATPSPLSQFGQNVVGDFNGDGVSDVVINGNPVNNATVAVLLTQMTQRATATASGIAIEGASGAHQVDASYAGDPNHLASTSGTVSLYLAATHFSVTAPPTVEANVPFTITVHALDANGVTTAGYTGTVSFTSTDGSAVLPAASKLTAGIGSFQVTLKTRGSQTITAADTPNSLTGTSAMIGVGAPPALTSPTAGSTLRGSSVTFRWSPAGWPTSYLLKLSTTHFGGSDVFGSTTSATSMPVSGIPTNGATLYATLSYKLSGTWGPYRLHLH